MTLGGTTSEAVFAAEAQAWLDQHLVGEFEGFTGDEGPVSDRDVEVRRRWERELGRGGWLGIGLPAEYGGRDATLAQQIAFARTYAASRAPLRRLTIQSTELIGPAIAHFGTAEQKQRFLPPITGGTELWCQGYSEPDAGSDLPNVTTAARLDGDEWIITGDKTWTTVGQWADWMYLVCRTEPGSQRHHGLSVLLMPMDQPGVEVRPIRNMEGGSEFAEVFLDAARTSADLVLGERGNGFGVAMAILGFERGTATIGHQMQFERELVHIIEAARTRELVRDPVVRQRLAQAWIELRILGLTNERKLTPLLRGEGTIGPEASISKLYWAPMHQRLTELGVDVLGSAALANGPHGARAPVARAFLSSRAETIYGGSNEIQRNTIGERVLGLPKEPRP